jgi:hypothetical protein
MYGGALRLLTSANVRIKLARLTRWNDIVLDTGSPNTMIGYNDALMMQTRISALPKEDREQVNMGARALWGYKSEAEYVFKCTNGEEYSVKLPVKILTPFTSTKVHIKAAQAVPSILGLDFLSHPKVRSISKDSETNEFYIEIK